MLESEGFCVGAQEQRAEWSDAAFSHRTHRKVINLLPGSFYLLSFDSLALTFPSKSYSSKCADLRLGYARCNLLSCSLSLFPGVHCSLPVTEVAMLTLRLVSVPSTGIWGNRRMDLNYGPQRLMGVARFQENVQDVFLIDLFSSHFLQPTEKKRGGKIWISCLILWFFENVKNISKYYCVPGSVLGASETVMKISISALKELRL